MSGGPKSGGGNAYVGNSLGGSSKGHFGDNYTYIYGDRKRRPPPPINCDKCSAKDIATKLHYHCAKCEDGDYDICIQCYRNGRGCHNWKDFRDARKREEEELKERYRLEAVQKEHSFRPRPPKVGAPHTLSARKYVPTTEDDCIAGSEDWQLQEGAFCESCLSLCGESYWNCKTCFGGGWGFCDGCVQKGKHCSHDLIPIQREEYCEKPSEARYVKQPPHLADGKYISLPTWHYCDTCQNEIPPGQSRLHCYICSDGHFDMCLKCFHQMYKDFQMPRGFKRWRRCFHRHRMALLEGQAMSAKSEHEHHQARVTVSWPLGGWRMVDDLRAIAKYDPDPETFTIGSTQTAVQSYFPDQADVKRGHLAFPIAAEIMEVENIGDEWAIGVYCGSIGKFPRWCVAQPRGHSRER